jgi:hypothetical protein
MCRGLACLGEPIVLEDLLYRPDVSLASLGRPGSMSVALRPPIAEAG